jgi:beta-N-acetylhexosaminidase
MEHLSKKPFYLTDEDILWVGNTLADMPEEGRITRLVIPPNHVFPLVPIIRKSADRIKQKRNEGFAAYIIDFPGDVIDERDAHLIVHMNTLTCEKWDKTLGADYSVCINEGVMAVMVAPVLFPAYMEKLNPGATEAQMNPSPFSYEITTLLLKEKLGFNGLVMAENITKPANLPLAIAAGCDMIISSGNADDNFTHIKKGIDDGTITQERLRAAIVQILGFTAALGLHK